MKIIQFIDSMYTGGAETSVCNCAVEMHRQKADVSVLCFSVRRETANETRLDEAGVPVEFIAEECLKKLHLSKYHDHSIRFSVQIAFSIPLFRKIMRRERPDVLHMHLDALLFYPFIPRRIKKGLRVFWTAHSDPEVILYKGPLAPFRRLILKRNPRINVLVLNSVSQGKMREYLLSNHVEVIRNGIDLKRYQSTVEDRELVREELHIPKDALVIGHIGRFGVGEAIKNQSFLVKLFEHMAEKKADVYLLLIGGGVLSAKLTDEIQACREKDRILVLTDRADVPRLLGAMDVFVMPSRYEGFPMTLIEAQAAGLRCVISDAVTKETALTDDICYLSLDSGEEKWMNTILHGGQAETTHGRLEDYDIANVVKKQIDLYYLSEKK